MRFAALGLLLPFVFATHALADCNEMVRLPWASAKKFKLTLEAHALGPKCATGTIVLLVVDEKGAVQWATTRQAKENLMFQDGITDGPTMKKALKEWLAQGQGTKPQEAKDLPVWKYGKERPEREGDGEFGFYAGDEVTQDFYESVRKENQPLFCFVQGIESTSCIAAAGPASIYDLGGFTFPG